ncbi:MAG TPA: AAA family ATPase, partial [Chlamydiales bacterium]|nr:AAA family ATPase [Chlamydiales bacterium]
MLKRLWLKNFVLADAVEISFQKGFNVITGETGSGKSIVLASLSFVLGDRAESSLIRHGASQATVEASFELDPKMPAIEILEEAGITLEDGELIIKRDIAANGKSRLFINHQSVTATLVKKIAPFLIEFCGQHTTTKLMDPRAP